MRPESFTPAFARQEIDDLRQRIALAERWRDQFDFAECARAWNRHRHFRAEVNGLPLHFIHAPRPEAPAVLLLHGWPGSFVEFLPLIDLLAPELSVIVPSVPGFGYSATAPELTPPEMADTLLSLMEQLGYPRFFVHGGDVGAGIGTWLARRHPERVLGLHLNYIPGSYAPDPGEGLSAEEEQFVRDAQDWWDRDGAYGHLQRTRPLTLGYALQDSPAGLAAWILEKWRSWTDSGGDPERRFSLDFLLTVVTLYWVTQTITPSIRDYFDNRWSAGELGAEDFVDVPTAIAVFANHFVPEGEPPREWAERLYDVRRWTPMPSGGHFAAAEEPELLARDIAAFFDEL